MSNLLDIITQNLGGDFINQIGSQFGVEDQSKTQNAASSAISVLMGALNKNASTPDGANILSSVLDRDHDGGILDDVMGYVTGSSNVANQKTVDGDGILNHILGDQKDDIISQIAQNSGISSAAGAGILSKLAPMVMGMLGKAKKENNLDAGGLSDLLKNSAPKPQNDSFLGGLLGKFLDKDKDGSYMDDLGQMGLDAVMKGIFGKK